MQSSNGRNAATAAGAVTEEDFLNAFEDVSAIKIYSARELLSNLQEIKNSLADPNNDWEKRTDSLKKLRSFLSGGAADYEEFHAELKTLEVPFQIAVKDLRSQVVREACITIGYLSERLGPRFDHFAETVFHALINLIKSSAKVMATSGLTACRFIIKNTHAPKLIPIVTSNLNSKSKEIRRVSCELLWQMLRDWPTQILDRHAQALQASIKQGLSDADSETRSSARKAYWAFSEHFKPLADALFASLDQSKQKLLRGEMSQSSSSSSLAALGPLMAPSSFAGVGGAAAARLRSSQENVLSSAANGVARLGYYNAPCSSMIPRSRYGASSGRSTSDIDTGAAKRAVLRHAIGVPLSAGRPSPAPAVAASASAINPALQQNLTSLSGSRSNSPSRIAVLASASSSGGRRNRPQLAVAPPTSFASLGRDPSPNRSTPYCRRLSENGRLNVSSFTSRDSADASFCSDIAAMRRANREKSEDVDGSETSSVCSVGDKTPGGGGGGSVDWELQETLAKCRSTHWSERRDGFAALQRRCQRDATPFKPHQLKRVCDVFARVFVDPHHKSFTIVLDALNDFIMHSHNELHDWLYLLLVRLLARQGNESLASLQSKLSRTVDVVRDTFAPDLQFRALIQYLTDPAQMPGVKVKTALLRYFNEVVHLMDPADFVDSPEVRQAVSKLVQWAIDPKTAEIRRSSQNLLLAIFSLNAPVFNAIVGTFAKGHQDAVHRLLQSQLQRQAGDVKLLSSVNSKMPGQHYLDMASEPIDLDYVYNSLRKTSEEIRNYTSHDVAFDLRRSSEDRPLNQRANGSHDSGIGIYADKGDNDVAAACKLMENLSVNDSELELQEEIIGGILTEMSNHNRRSVERRKAMATLLCMTRDGSFTLWDEHFKSILLILLETLGDSDSEVRVQALRTLKEICVCQSPRFRDYAELTLLRVLEAHKDAAKDVARAADECAAALASRLPPGVCLRVFSSTIRGGQSQVPLLLAALKMTAKLIEQQMNADQLENVIRELVPDVIQCYNHSESCVRKASVLCLVAVHNCVGGGKLEPFLEGLSTNKIKLLHMYINKTQSPTLSH